MFIFDSTAFLNIFASYCIEKYYHFYSSIKLEFFFFFLKFNVLLTELLINLYFYKIL